MEKVVAKKHIPRSTLWTSRKALLITARKSLVKRIVAETRSKFFEALKLQAKRPSRDSERRS